MKAGGHVVSTEKIRRHPRINESSQTGKPAAGSALTVSRKNKVIVGVPVTHPNHHSGFHQAPSPSVQKRTLQGTQGTAKEHAIGQNQQHQPLHFFDGRLTLRSYPVVLMVSR
jgi:hypothetical protein